MSDELKAAVDRVRRMRADSDAFDGGYPDTPDGRQQSLFDHVKLAEAYLAEHLADDSEPVTIEWLVEIGFSTGSYPRRKTPIGDMWWVAWPQHGGVQGMHGVYSHIPNIKTRGDVRRLLAALGITEPAK